MTPMQLRTKQIDELIETIRDTMYTFPHLRLGQLLINAIPDGSYNLYYTDDTKVTEWFKLYIKNYGRDS